MVDFFFLEGEGGVIDFELLLSRAFPERVINKITKCSAKKLGEILILSF